MVQGSPTSQNTEICLSSKGLPNLRVTRDGDPFLIHPQDDPVSETDEFLNMVPEASTGVVVQVGMGLGYSALSLMDKRPKIQNFIFFEPDTGIFIQALTCMDLKPILKDPRVMLCIGPDIDIEKITNALSRTLQLENIHILKHLPLRKAMGGDYLDCYNKVFDALISYNMEGATLIHHGEKFFNNRFAHFRTMHHHRLLQEIQNAYSGIPAIMVAAGPSLDQNIHLLSQAKDKAVIIAVDSALPALLARDITPDFVTAIDYDVYTYEKIASVSPIARGSSLVCMPWVDISVTKKFPAENVYWAFTSVTFEKWMNSCLGGNMSVGGVGTVAHLNIITAIILGCSPCVFMGQDLSYSGETDHAENVALGYSQDMEQALARSDGPRIKAIDGSLLPTRNDFISYKNMFEKIISSNPGHYINSTARGAHIEGTLVMPLESVIEKFCTRKKPHVPRSDHSKALPSPPPTGMLEELNGLKEQIRKIGPVMKRNQKNLKDALRDVTRMNKNRQDATSFAGLPKNLQKKILKIDNDNKAADRAGIIWGLLENLTMEGLRQSERMISEIKRMADQPDMYLGWLQKSLKRLSDINQTRSHYLFVLGKRVEELLWFLSREQRIADRISPKGPLKKDLTDLAQLYFDHGDYTIAKPLLLQIKAKGVESATVSYQLGCIAGFQTDFEKMAGYFNRASTQDASMGGPIQRFRRKIAAQYLGYCDEYDQYDTRSALNFLIKGALYDPDHPDIQNRFHHYLDKDIKIIEQAALNQASDLPGGLALDWEEAFKTHPGIEQAIDKQQLTRLFLGYARIRRAADQLSLALPLLDKAAALDPEDPEIQVLLADTCIANNEFDKGVACLEKAVALDINYAKCWENLGDALAGINRVEDAIAAYEKCFMATPANVGALKKIGDCHMAAGRMEAAKEAYEQLKSILENHGSEKKEQ